MSLPSPCIDVCRMDPASGLCDGCLRTLDEIAAWSIASDEQQRQILAAIAQRRATLSPPFGKIPPPPPFVKGGNGGI